MLDGSGRRFLDAEKLAPVVGVRLGQLELLAGAQGRVQAQPSGPYESACAGTAVYAVLLDQQVIGAVNGGTA